MIEVAAGILMDARGRVLLMQRLPGKHLAGLWEFPGGKVEPGETVAQALVRELDEELGVEVLGGAPMISIPWHYPEKSVRLHALRITAWNGEPRAREGHPLRGATAVSQLAACHWIVVGDPTRPGQQDESIQELFLQHRLREPTFAAVSDSIFGAISMLLDSDCVARLPAQLLTHPMTVGKLVEIEVAEQAGLVHQIGIVSKRSTPLSPPADDLRKLIVQEFAAMRKG